MKRRIKRPRYQLENPDYPRIADVKMDRRGMLVLLGAGAAMVLVGGCGSTQPESPRPKDRLTASPSSPTGPIDMFPDAGPFNPDGGNGELHRPTEWRINVVDVAGKPPSARASEEDIERVNELERKVKALEESAKQK